MRRRKRNQGEYSVKLPDNLSVVPTNVPTSKIIVLRSKLMPHKALEILEKKKTTLFGSTLRRPNPSQITVKTPQLYFEQVIHVSGIYSVDFDRDVSYTIKVEPDVSEIKIGDNTFPVVNRSGTLKNLEKKMKQGVGFKKQDLEIRASERAVKSIDDSLYLDCHGLETTLPYHLDSDSVENYPQRILDIDKDYIRSVPLDKDEIYQQLARKLQTQLDLNIKIHSQDYIVKTFEEIFVPVYEARCYDDKQKSAIGRVDALTGQFF